MSVNWNKKLVGKIKFSLSSWTKTTKTDINNNNKYIEVYLNKDKGNNKNLKDFKFKMKKILI